ncbi:MAG: TonB-dependent receptor plug domain-containing protein [Pseudomonadota bacterium]
MHQKDIKKGLYTVSGFALLAAMPSFAMAQAAAPAAGETVVVTGLRGSLSRSITAKRVSDMVTENISAEEIGKLPDASIAEALARLPGLAGQRVGGEVEVINLRGTSPDFTTTTLNGRQLGSLSDGRGIEINQFPSELINGVTVYKTPNAAVAGQGLSGTIDLKSLRP